MANTFNLYTPEELGDVAIGLADTGLKLGQHVTRFADGSFVSGSGHRAYLRVPGVLSSRVRAIDDITTVLSLDTIKESRVEVDLSAHRVSAVAVGDAELTLNLRDFSTQVLAPQVDSVVDGLEHSIAKALASVEPTAGIAYDPAKPTNVLIRARRALRDRGIDVAESDLVAFVGGNVADALLESGALSYANTGDADALRGGALGRVHGFQTVESGRIGADEVIAMVKGAVYLATRAPRVPEGAAFGQNVSKDGITLRYLRDYDASRLVERSVVSTFSGAGIAPLFDVVRDHETGASSISEVEGGAVVKIDTSAA